MEEVVLTIGGIFSLFSLSDIIFFAITLFVIVLLLYVIYLSRVGDKKDTETKKDPEISRIIDELEKTREIAPIELSEYEQEQENTAIISFDELKKASMEQEQDECLEESNNITFNHIEENRKTIPKRVSEYEDEERFLESLKTLQKNLVR